MKLLFGLILGFAIGALCFVFSVPAPAPPVIQGALLVVAMTLGYGLMDRLLIKPATTKHQCGGPVGRETEQQGEQQHD